MKRILILGCCGAGKSALARKLSAQTNIPIIHLDQQYWQAGWVETPLEIWEERVGELVQQENWIMDGNYSGSLHLRLPHADTIIYLDLPRWVCLRNIFKRWIQYAGRTRPDMSVGCPEQLDWEFLRYVYNFRKTHRPRTLQKLSALRPNQKLYLLKNRKAINEWFNDIML